LNWTHVRVVGVRRSSHVRDWRTRPDAGGWSQLKLGVEKEC